MEKTTIYQIIGGGQRVRQNTNLGIPTVVQTVHNSDYVEKSKCEGVDSFTNCMWSVDKEYLQRWANEWAGGEVQLVYDDAISF